MNATTLSRALRVFRPLSARLFSQSNGTELLGHASTCIRQEPSAKAGLDDSGFTGHIPLEDLKISYSYSGGAGGQHVNKTTMSSEPPAPSGDKSGQKLSPEHEALVRTKLGSIAPECDAVKTAYDTCFQKFFPQFLKGSTTDPCVEKLVAYQKCLREHLNGMGIDMTELDASKMDADSIASIVNRR
ncbi:unnamed protein product [Calicophoron daubneyi]|uniref:Uncharacterized protein n=1 Tax=Calicophoron daubneyi TaxID=300641 RepID=A0AAV2T9R3_CALDB